MRVWIVRAIWDYECDDVIAVFDSIEKANALKRSIESNPTGKDYYGSDRFLNTYDRFEIEEHEIGWVSECVPVTLR